MSMAQSGGEGGGGGGEDRGGGNPPAAALAALAAPKAFKRKSDENATQSPLKRKKPHQRVCGCRCRFPEEMLQLQMLEGPAFQCPCEQWQIENASEEMEEASLEESEEEEPMVEPHSLEVAYWYAQSVEDEKNEAFTKELDEAKKKLETAQEELEEAKVKLAIWMQAAEWLANTPAERRAESVAQGEEDANQEEMYRMKHQRRARAEADRIVAILTARRAEAARVNDTP